MVNDIKLDNREPSNVQKLGLKLIPNLTITSLPVGDFVCNARSVCIERKTIEDFKSSITGDGRLWEQAVNMAENYEHRFLIIIGNYENLSPIDRDRFGVKQYKGAIASLRARYGIHVFNVMNNREFFNEGYQLMKKCDGNLKLDRVRRFNKHKKEDILTGMLTCIPGIGYKHGKRIIEHFQLKGVKELCNLTMEDLLQVDGIGEKKAKRVKNYFN